MNINVRHIAKLANLKIEEKEIKKFEKQLSSILSHIDNLKEINTEKTEETSQTTGLENVTREDEVDSSKTLTQDDALSNTKSKRNGLFVIKAIFQNE